MATDFASIAIVSLLFGTIAQHLDITSPLRERRFRRLDAER